MLHHSIACISTLTVLSLFLLYIKIQTVWAFRTCSIWQLLIFTTPAVVVLNDVRTVVQVVSESFVHFVVDVTPPHRSSLSRRRLWWVFLQQFGEMTSTVSTRIHFTKVEDVLLEVRPFFTAWIFRVSRQNRMQKLSNGQLSVMNTRGNLLAYSLSMQRCPAQLFDSDVSTNRTHKVVQQKTTHFNVSLAIFGMKGSTSSVSAAASEPTSSLFTRSCVWNPSTAGSSLWAGTAAELSGLNGLGSDNVAVDDVKKYNEPTITSDSTKLSIGLFINLIVYLCLCYWSCTLTTGYYVLCVSSVQGEISPAEGASRHFFSVSWVLLRLGHFSRLRQAGLDKQT